jgi:hypothetical protein
VKGPQRLSDPPCPVNCDREKSSGLLRTFAGGRLKGPLSLGVIDEITAETLTVFLTQRRKGARKAGPRLNDGLAYQQPN